MDKATKKRGKVGAAVLGGVAIIWGIFWFHGHFKELGGEWGGNLTPEVAWSDARQARWEKLRDLDSIYRQEYTKEKPTTSIMPCRDLVPLSLNESQIKFIEDFDREFEPRWIREMTRCTTAVQDAYVQFVDARAAGNADAMNVARTAVADAVASHKKTLEKLNSEYHDEIFKVLNKEQQAKYVAKPVNRSPLPKM